VANGESPLLGSFTFHHTGWTLPDSSVAMWTCEPFVVVNPWDGYSISQTSARITSLKSTYPNLKIAVRAHYRGDRSIPAENDMTELNQFLNGVVDAAKNYQPFRDHVSLWICANEPNITNEGAVPASWAQRVLNGGTALDNFAEKIRYVAGDMGSLPNAVIGSPAVAPYDPTVNETDSNWRYSATAHPYLNYLHSVLKRAKAAGDAKARRIVNVACLHVAGRIGSGGSANGGRLEPRRSVVEQTYGSQFGTQAIREMVQVVDAAFASLPLAVDEFTTYMDGYGAEVNYVRGWLQEALKAIDYGVNRLATPTGRTRLWFAAWFIGRGQVGADWSSTALEHLMTLSPGTRGRDLVDEFNALVDRFA